MRVRLWQKSLVFLLCSISYFTQKALALGIHNVPIILSGGELRPVLFHPLASYRVFRTDKDGLATAIPFQIDQKDKFGDYILEEGKNPNSKASNGMLNYQDELTIMGNDVGVRNLPLKWPVRKPDVVYELIFRRGLVEGAVYIGIYRKDPPPIAKEKYVSFDLPNAEVLTSRYRYLFNDKNYLVVRGVNIEKPEKKEEKIIFASTVFMRIDLKYFLTFNIGHSDIVSALDAYKAGPVRVIARVNFDYTMLKLRFDLGMYTEVSFFSNAVYLPAIIDNPFEGKKTLNNGSYFYYGLALVENPEELKPETNMPNFKEKGNFFSSITKNTLGQYWASAKSKDYMFYLEFQPSTQMQKDENIPYLYFEDISGENLIKRKDVPLPLGQSRANIAVSFDLDNLRAGLHEVKFRLFIENNSQNDKILDEFKTVSEWRINSMRLPL